MTKIEKKPTKFPPPRFNLGSFAQETKVLTTVPTKLVCRSREMMQTEYCKNHRINTLLDAK